MHKVILVVSSACPYCPKAKDIWEKIKNKYNNVELEIVDVITEKGKEIIRKHNIMAVPTTLIDDKIVFVGIPDVNKAIEFISR
ncbi:MAG: thioredoxin family protein [Candidatus Aenigmarchaeota archaeon]|nr:thioredoxin family protein [Candidatus Aenigmarchaeota archaeon]MDW8149283.1 thioredoxin family protein [Candidatus Aenigmarchaeota archaeon]